MKILDTRVYRGPNYWLYKPAINMTVDLEELEAYPTDKLGDFVDNLLAQGCDGAAGCHAADACLSP